MKRGVFCAWWIFLEWLDGEWHDVARAFVSEGIGIFLHCGCCLCGSASLKDGRFVA
ncbi:MULTISPECIES: hypothetical protein [unclassified Bartonella]|uniref:hypothetical protein n=1 Tax=unclassified Bartonella TaxID=2645622 RepID=UPI0035CF851D